MYNLYNYKKTWGFDQQSTGSEFENDFIDLLSKSFKNSKTYKIVSYVGSDIDKKEGTDLTCGNLRLDPTLNFSGKNNVTWLYETNIEATPCQNFKIGMRIGNQHNGKFAQFKEPVIVIGIDMIPEDYKLWKTCILENIQKQSYELMDIASDCYEDYTTIDLEDRIDTIEPLLVESKNCKKILSNKLNGGIHTIEKFRATLKNSNLNEIKKYMDEGDLNNEEKIESVYFNERG